METEVLIQGSGSEESCQRLQIYSHLIRPKSLTWPFSVNGFISAMETMLELCLRDTALETFAYTDCISVLLDPNSMYAARWCHMPARKDTVI